MKWIHSAVDRVEHQHTIAGMEVAAPRTSKRSSHRRAHTHRGWARGTLARARCRRHGFPGIDAAAGQPDGGALFAAQDDTAAGDAQGSRKLVFTGGQDSRRRSPVQRRLYARGVVAGGGREPLGRWRQTASFTPPARYPAAGEIHDAVSAGIVQVVQAMVRAREGPITDCLRMQCASRRACQKRPS